VEALSSRDQAKAHQMALIGSHSLLKKKTVDVSSSKVGEMRGHASRVTHTDIVDLPSPSAMRSTKL